MTVKKPSLLIEEDPEIFETSHHDDTPALSFEYRKFFQIMEK